jgi:hypothetical protein
VARGNSVRRVAAGHSGHGLGIETGLAVALPADKGGMLAAAHSRATRRGPGALALGVGRMPVPAACMISPNSSDMRSS